MIKPVDGILWPQGYRGVHDLSELVVFGGNALYRLQNSLPLSLVRIDCGTVEWGAMANRITFRGHCLSGAIWMNSKREIKLQVNLLAVPPVDEQGTVNKWWSKPSELAVDLHEGLSPYRRVSYCRIAAYVCVTFTFSIRDLS